jgi:hypothetical protein
MKTVLFIPVIAVIGILAYLSLQPGSNLAAVFEKRKKAMTVNPVGNAPITMADVAHLPLPVQRYLQVTGTVGKPPVSMVHATFNTTLYSVPNKPGMSGTAHQIDVIDPLRRFFFMETRMKGLPVAVLHDYNGTDATMRVRMMRLFDVMNVAGPGISKTETVTILNDFCLFAPSALIRPEFKWTPVSESEADVTYTNGPHQVGARLFFDAEGHLVDFRSEDRGELTPDGKLTILPWTTPARNFRTFGGRVVPGYGEAIWHRPEGPFTYGTFEVLDVAYDTTP